jgi:hypothetical protein
MQLRSILKEYLPVQQVRWAWKKFLSRIIERIFRHYHATVFWGDQLLTLDKSAGFMSDPRFLKAYQAIRGSHIYDDYDSPHTIAWRLHTLVWAAQRAVDLPGDFVECGVFKGDMSWVVTQMVDFGKLPKKFYLYDTFLGFSPKYSSVDDFPDNRWFFDFANSVYKDENIYPMVVNKFKDLPNVQIVRGVVPESFTQALPERISYLHIDLNSPAAEIAALEVLFDRVVAGGIIVFDDYGWYQYRKQKEAEDIWFAARGYHVLELPTGQGMVVKRP